VKLHTGYFAGTGHMMLDRVSQNASDLCRLVQEFPDITFVVMHIGYPFQEQMIALAKHYPNVAIDMCWAWIVNPAASVRFVKDFLMAVPSNKLLTFGGDYVAVEQVVGHAKVARRGLTRALSELVHEGWLSVGEALALVPELMNGNARSIFGQGSAEGAAGA
jgi:predicted TIM-barrel fold metal-dependent hydrolase